MKKIDFVITWVDDTDTQWIAEKQKYQETEEIVNDIDANSGCRYRSNPDLLRYWFRSVEKFAPWVNKIHFVTCGQTPDWLNENHPKLSLVNHSDYIPSQYLPTFNSNTIELNYHRIVDLSEHYVLFNDDMFLLQSVNPDFFFHDGNPVLDTNLSYTKLDYSMISRVMFNNYSIVNNSFDIGKSIWQNRKKWFNFSELGYKRTKRNLLCYFANKTIPIGVYGHLALPHLKSTLDEIWGQHYIVMDQTCSCKFRNDQQVNQWLCCAWNQAKGSFYPTKDMKKGVCYPVATQFIDQICDIIKNQRAPQICINDGSGNTEPERCDKEIIQAFASILPEKSSFEL